MYFLSIRFISFFISTLDFGFNENGKSEFSKIFIQPNFFFLNVIGIKSDISNSFSFLRRSIAKIDIKRKATNIMKSRPILASSDLLISSAIVLMNKYSITSLIIANRNKPIGIVNIKKCLENE